MSSLITAAVISTGAAIHNKEQAQNAKERAAKGLDQAQGNAIDAQDEYYDQTRTDWADYRDTGTNALARINSTQGGDYSAFQASPGYQFRMDEGARNAENSFSNRGGGGNAMRAMEDYRQNMASNEFGNWWNRQNQLVNYGAQGTHNTQVAGQNRANNTSNIYMRTGENQAGLTLYGAQQQAEYLNQGLSSLYGGFNAMAGIGSGAGGGNGGFGRPQG